MSQLPESREDFVVEAPEHNTSIRKSKTEEMCQRLEQAIEDHPYANQKELAEILGISQARVSQLKRKLSSTSKS